MAGSPAEPGGLPVYEETAEDTQDTQFELINTFALALCDRSAGLPQTAGHFGVVFEPSVRGDPPVFGNQPQIRRG